MEAITGKGFLIWKLTKVLPVSRILDALRQADCSWVCIKVANGVNKYNSDEIGGDQNLKDIIQQLKDAGFKVGGWQFIFTRNIAKLGLQAATIGERVQKLGLDFIMVDAEEVGSVGAYWKSHPDRNADAHTYTDVLRGGGVPLSMPVYLCTYRFPYLHSAFPFSVFLKSESVNGVAQQLYWVGDDNPREQLAESIRQYDDWGNKYETMLPIGAAFGEHGWIVTPEQITEFVESIDEFGLPGCGFWVLDEAINHPEWLDAIANGTIPNPPPPETEKVPMEEWAVYIDEWARTMGYDGPAPLVDINKPYQVIVNTPNSNLLVRANKDGSVVDRLADGTVVTVYPPTFLVSGYTRGEIDQVGSNRWIALEFTNRI